MHPGPSGTRRTVGDVCHPRPVRRIDIELPSKGVIDHNRWLAAIGARTALIADLRLDPGQLCKTGDAVDTTGLSLIEKVVMQLSIAIDPAALFPRLVEEFGLTCILPSPFAQWSLQPGIKAAGLDAQAATHRADSKLLAMLGNKRVSHFASLAKYAVAYGMARPSPLAHDCVVDEDCTEEKPMNEIKV